MLQTETCHQYFQENNMKLNTEEMIFLLSAIKLNGNIAPLASIHSYTDIIDEIKNCIEKGWIVHEDKLLLTNDGEKEMENLMKKQKMLKRDWVKPYFQFKTDKIDENYIYLPHNIDKLE